MSLLERSQRQPGVPDLVIILIFVEGSFGNILAAQTKLDCWKQWLDVQSTFVFSLISQSVLSLA